ncbi:unnamed protein product [Calicophoron daubneyi]|uniref:RNA helicase n=1 Tax=Calicophoron daubneyi TaxID=300641 RepID=A0AAV2T5J8_CALDB
MGPRVEISDGDLVRFDISKKLVERLKQRGVEELFPVQRQTFNIILGGDDAVVLARTGTGKTLAFSLPIVQRLLSDNNSALAGRSPKVLVLAPTRELVTQITGDFQSICAEDVAVISVYGGAPLGPQCRALRGGVDIVVGTPGRVIDLMKRSVLNLSAAHHVVLDEVDRMLDMGFAKDVETILSELYSEDSAKKPQTLLFSATMPSWVETVAENYLSKDAHRISLIEQQENKTALNVSHCALPCSFQERASTISDVIRVYCKNHESRCIVFCDRKKDADELAANTAMSDSCHVFHGDVPQDKRELILKKFRDGKYRTLITTNVAARGLDVPEVDLVIQCHPPACTEDYIHRSGRTGRAERSGTSIVFYIPREWDMLKRVEADAGIQFRRISAPTLKDIMNSLDEELFKSFLSMPDATWSAFMPMAESLVQAMQNEGQPNSDKKKASKKKKVKTKQASDESANPEESHKMDLLTRALCCALARLSGKDGTVESRSLLNAQKGLTTYRLDLNHRAERKGEAYGVLRQQLPDEVTESIRNLGFIEGRTGFVFDLPSDFNETVSSSWTHDSDGCELKVLQELPELEQEEFDHHSSQNRGNFRGGWRGGRSNGRNGYSSTMRNQFGRGQNGLSFNSGRGGFGRGAKRGGNTFDSHQQTSKRIRFDSS